MLVRDFIENGIAVFSLHSHHNGQCSCSPDHECKAIGKHPRASNWQSSPLWSDEQLELMEETNQFLTGYGVLCKNLIVIDVDARNGGLESYAALINDIPEVASAGLIVATGSGSGSKHLYFRAPEPPVSLLRHLPKYPGLDFQSGNSFVVGPESIHATGNKYEILHGSVDEIDYAPQALIGVLTKPERHRTEYSGIVMDVSHQDIADMLSYINADCDHETWVRIGMAIHHATGGTAFAVWDEWSSQGSKYPDQETLETRWHSFGRSSMPVTIGTLIHYAEDNGWKRPVEFTEDTTFPVIATAERDPLDTSDIDLHRPPGFVGKVKQWMDEQCIYPRENLTLGAALITIGNIMGLRYTDDTTGVTANMFVFGVAGSASGKEAVLQGATEIMRVSGLSPATHGVIKSEQEVIRNLIRHQPAYYLIDEIGIQLRKIKNAQARGGAAHLEGVFGVLMSAYSKANGYLLIGGDVKEEIRAVLAKELSRYIKMAENNEIKEDDPRIQSAQKNMEMLEFGLKDPFISIMGFTTPETFDDMMDFEQATSGFIGRSLLISEKETNPKPKRNFSRTLMTDKMINQLQALRHGGHFCAQDTKIEYRHDRSIIQTTPEAKQVMDLCLDWFINYAEQQKSTSGLEAVVRRGFELMCKVSLVLSCEGVRTLDHVRYAFALVKRDLDTKLGLVVSNDKTARADTRLFAMIEKHMDTKTGITFGVIKNKLRSHKEEDIKKALEILIEHKKVLITSDQHPINGKAITRYYKA